MYRHFNTNYYKTQEIENGVKLGKVRGDTVSVWSTFAVSLSLIKWEPIGKNC